MIPKFSSLKIKFTLIAISIGLISFGVAAILANLWTAKEFEKTYQEKAIFLGTLIIHDLETAMVSTIHGTIQEILRIYQTYDDLHELRVFNLKGEEVFVKEKAPSEAGVDEALRTGRLIHSHKVINKKQVASYIIPIKNNPKCHNCHGKGEFLRGALLLSFPLEEMERDIARQMKRFSVLFGVIAIGICIVTISSVNRLFLKPLSHIQKGTEAIGKGEFQYQIPVQSKDEIGTLADNFNRMAQLLQGKNEMLWEQVRLLSRSQKEWRETFDSITDLIAVIDKDFNITRANRAFHEYFTISPYAEINKKCHELLGTCHESECLHIKSMENRRPASSELHDAKTGKILQVSFFPYFSPEGDSLGSIFIGKDITEKKENDMRLIMNERLAALGEMASGIAHEINNPLATIAACTEALLNRMEKEKIDSILFQSYLRIIEEEIDRCKSITTSMLSFVRKVDNEKKGVIINEALDRAIEMVTFQGRLKNVVYLKNFQTEMPQVQGNESELRQVFLTIIVNALDAMEDKGTLTIETGTEGNTVFVKISDTGPGIPSDLIGRIFDPFFTTKSEKGGTGLGLSIAKRIVQENNGRIDVASEEGKGTTFTIILPIS